MNLSTDNKDLYRLIMIIIITFSRNSTNLDFFWISNKQSQELSFNIVVVQGDGWRDWDWKIYYVDSIQRIAWRLTNYNKAQPIPLCWISSISPQNHRIMILRVLVLEYEQHRNGNKWKLHMKAWKPVTRESITHFCTQYFERGEHISVEQTQVL